MHDPALDPAEARARLGAIRAAAEILGIGEIHLLPYRDLGMAGTDANRRPDAFVSADLPEAAARVAAIVRTARPGVVVTYDPAGGYGHPDHVTAHRVTLAAIERAAADGPGADGAMAAGWAVPKLYYTVVARSALLWLNGRMRARGLAAPFDEEEHAFDIRQRAAPDDVITARVPVRDYLDRVRAALRAYRTQLPADDPLLTLPPDLAAAAFGVESYIRAFSRVPAPAREEDLFDGVP